MSALLSDPELLVRIAAGEARAITELMQRYSPAVRRMLIRTLGSTVDVDDLLQETFLTVVRRALSVRDPNALASFVLGVAIRHAKNELRRRAIRRGADVDDSADVISWDDDPITRECLRHLGAALDELDEASRRLVILRHVEGLELTEVAEAQGVSLATVKRRLAKAERRFLAIAARDPVLGEYLGRRFRQPPPPSKARSSRGVRTIALRPAFA